MNDGSIRVGTKLDLSGIKSDIKALEKELATVQKEADKLTAKEEKVKETFVAEREVDSMVDERYRHKDYIDEREAEALSKIREEREYLNQKAQEYNSMLDEANAKLQQQQAIASASKELDSAVKANSVLDKIKSQEQYNSLLAETRAKMAEIESLAASIAKNRGVDVNSLLAANPQYQKLAETLKVLESTTRQFGSEAERAGQRARDGFRSARKEANKFGTGVTNLAKKVIKTSLKMTLAIFGIRGAYRAVRMAMTEYMATNQELESKLSTIKSYFGQILGPAIERVVNLFWSAINAVNAFIYALSGINLAAKANAAALKKQAGAASAAKAQLAGFDEMNRLNDSSGGGGGSSPALLDETFDITPFTEKVRELFKSGEFYELGKYLSEKLVEWINNIDWKSVGTKIGEFLGDVISFVLGFALQLRPDDFAGAINGFIGNLLKGLANSLQNVDWVEVGKNLLDLILWGLALSNPANAIIAILLSPNSDDLVSGAAELIGTIISALAQAIIGSAIRFGELATALWDGIKGYFDEYVNWEGTPGEIINGLFDGIVAALSGVGSWVKENVWLPFAEGFRDSINWDSETVELVEGFFQGIIDALADIGRWVYDNIWVPFRDAFKEAFGIHSPSLRMKEFGGDIIDGLWQGIIGGLAKIKQTCITVWETIKGVFSTVGQWFETTFHNAWEKVKGVFSKGGITFEGIKEGISETFKTIVNGLIGGINTIIAKPFNAINSVLNRIRSIQVIGITPFAGMWGYNPLSVPQIPKLAVGGIVNRPGRGVPAIIGEAGAEAVLPLENNTEWMDILADKIGGNVTIPIYMDGKKIATYVVDIQKKKAFAMNGA